MLSSQARSERSTDCICTAAPSFVLASVRASTLRLFGAARGSLGVGESENYRIENEEDDGATLSFCIMIFKSSRILKILRFLNSSIMSFAELIQFSAILK